MNLRQIIDHVESVRPSAFRPDEKVTWLNELEYSIQTDVLRMNESFLVHNWYEEWSGTGVSFPDDKTIVLPARRHFNPGGKLRIEGCTEAENDKEARILVSAWDGDTTTLTFASGTFTASEEEASIRIEYDGAEEKMLAPEQWNKIYYTYLLAQEEFNDGEYNTYGNVMQMFNSWWSEYLRWYDRNYIDPED